MTADHDASDRTRAGVEPPTEGLGLVHEHDRTLRLTYRGTDLARYVYRPWDKQLESPRPYFHPLHTLGGDLVSLYRPHDHVWHKGIAWSLPNAGPTNFWGGPTYLRYRGYLQLDNNGSTVHRGFDDLEVGTDRVTVAERLEWLTQQGETHFAEQRGFAAVVDPAASVWTLLFTTALTNVTDEEIRIGSPTTEGRENAGYGGLFWRGPRSFSGGHVYGPDQSGGDELMGMRAPWLAYVGRHDEHDGSSTLVFVDDPDNAGHPVEWFVRTSVYACVCPAPFFSEEVPAAPGETLSYRYAVVIADGGHDHVGAAKLADTGRAVLESGGA